MSVRTGHAICSNAGLFPPQQQKHGERYHMCCVYDGIVLQTIHMRRRLHLALVPKQLAIGAFQASDGFMTQRLSAQSMD